MKEFFNWFKTEGWKKYILTLFILASVDFGFIANFDSLITSGTDTWGLVFVCLLMGAINLVVALNIRQVYGKRNL